MEKIKYSDIRDSLNTFDIVLFSGKGLVSNTIKAFSRSKFSHVGMVVRQEDITFKDTKFKDGGIILFESTTLGRHKDIFSNKYNKGVQFVYLSDKIKNYKGKVYIRKLNVFNRDSRRHETMIKNLNLFMQEMEHKKYESSKLELLFSCIPFIDLSENLNTVFCSELVAEAYERAYLLPEVISSNSYTPDSFSKTLLVNQSVARLDSVCEVYFNS